MSASFAGDNFSLPVFAPARFNFCCQVFIWRKPGIRKKSDGKARPGWRQAQNLKLDKNLRATMA